MDKFEEIIQQKVNQFKPEFNEAHWNALDSKLTTIKRIKLLKTTAVSALAVAVVTIGIYLSQNKIEKLPVEAKKTLSQLPVDNTKRIEEPQSNEKTTPVTVNTTNSSLTQQKITEKINIVDNSKIENNTTIEPSVQSNQTTEQNKSQMSNLQPNNAEFTLSDKTICLGEEISLSPSDGGDMLAYKWNFGDGNESSKLNSKYTYKAAGTYTITLQVNNKRTGEEYKTSQSIFVLPLPNTDFTYLEESTQNDDNKLKYPKTIFSCKGEITDVYEWKIANFKSTSEKQPEVIIEKAGDYQVTLKAKNSKGCVNSLTKTVTITNSFELFAPNAFTPNFDGNNDEFLPEALSTWDIKFEMIVKNNAGNVVFKTTDKNNAWKGSLNNTGNILEEGIYFWQVITYDVDNKPSQHIGRIKLMK